MKELNMNLNEVKKQAAELVNNAIESRVNELLETHNSDSLKKQFTDFEDDPYNTKKYYIQFDECGMLDAVMVLDLPEWLEYEDTEVIEALLSKLMEHAYIKHDTDGQWLVHQCLGSPTIVNWNAGRNEYTIYSDELKLKVLKVVDEKHAMLLIEQAMRKAGVFENIVEVDYHGQFMKFLSTGMGKLKDKTISQRLKKYEDINE